MACVSYYLPRRAHRRAIPQCRRAFGGFACLKISRRSCACIERNGVDFSMLKEAERVNKRRIDQFMEKVRRALWVVKDKQVGALGLAFKPAPTIYDFRSRLKSCAACSPKALTSARPTRWPWTAPGAFCPARNS